MPLIFITGLPGSGKSTLMSELTKQGYEAYDTDSNGITSWVDNATGEKVARPLDESERTKEWYSKHSWNLDEEVVKSLKEQARKRTVFLCGSTTNQEDLRQYFDKVIFLQVNEAILRERLAKRTTNDFGKSPDELENILSWKDGMEQRWKGYGAIFVDAESDEELEIENIIRIAES